MAGHPPSWYRTFDGERPPLDVLFIITLTSSVRVIKKSSADLSFRITSGKRWYRFYFDREDEAMYAHDAMQEVLGALPAAGSAAAEGRRNGSPSQGRRSGGILDARETNGVVDGFFPGMNMIERRKLADELKESRDRWDYSHSSSVSSSKLSRVVGLEEAERPQFQDSLRSPSAPSVTPRALASPSSSFGVSFHSDTSPSPARANSKKRVLAQERLGFGSSSTTRRSGARADNVRYGYYMAKERSGMGGRGAETGIDERFDADSPHRPRKNESGSVDMSIFKSPKPKGRLRRTDSSDSSPSDLPSRRRYIGLKWAQSEYVKERIDIEKNHLKKPGQPSRSSNLNVLT